METKRMRGTLAVLTLSAMLAFAPVVHGDPGAGRITMADLEQGFWVCDYLGTTRGAYGAPMELCGAIYDELKARKFENDFERLFDWWREHKTVEHGKLEAGGARSQILPSRF
jgi:hypothetical protein